MLRKLIAPWVRNKEGTTAIEFSLLAIPYVFLTVGIIEMAMMFTTASMLEAATGSAARMIRTGQIQQATNDPATQQNMFRDAFCEFAVLVNCSQVQLEVINIGDFSSFGDFAPSFDGDGNMVSQGFDSGGVSDVILIRVAYRYTLMTPFIGNLLGESGTNSRLFVSTVVLQNEPYEFVDIDDV